MPLDKRDPQVLLAYPDLGVSQESLVLKEEEEILVYPDQKVHKANREKEDLRELEDLKDLLGKPEITEIRVHRVQLASLEQLA